MFIFFSEKLNIAQPFLNQCQDLNVSLTFKAQRLSEGVAQALGAPAASAERWSSVPSTLSSGSPLPTAPVLGIRSMPLSSTQCLCPPQTPAYTRACPLRDIHSHAL